MFKIKTTMKKTYINPNIEVVKIASQSQMLAGSLNKNSQAVSDNKDVLGRSFDFDDEEY